MLADYKGDIKVVYKNYVVHPSTATEPALAGCAAGLQNKFPAMAKSIWTDAYNAGRDFSRSNLETIAKKTKLNMRRFRKDRDGVCRDIIAKEQAQVAAVGVTGTPAFFINGRFLSGAQPISRFKTLIDEELAKANKKIRDGAATKANYYERFVRVPGLTKLK